MSEVSAIILLLVELIIFLVFARIVIIELCMLK